MAFNFDNLVRAMEEYRSNQDFQALFCIIKTSVECKQRIPVDVNDNHWQQYCHILASMFVKNIQKEDEDSELIVILCEALLHQVTFDNIRWYLIDRCHVLECLTKRFFRSQNQLLQIKISKTIQIFLIYSEDEESRSSINQQLVSELLKKLADILQGNYSNDYNESTLGLLASLCQIWGNCQQVMNVIDDYQVLRKQLLRFLSAEMVKRTTIAYTMTIMFHLCNSDDRLFNKRNIRQTLQVLFNIMLNGDTEWASLYSSRLLTEICRSSRTCHLLTEYRCLPMSLKNTILQISGKERIVIQKHLEFIVVISRVNAEYRHIITEILIPTDGGNVDLKESGNLSNCNDPMGIIIHLTYDLDISISVYALTLLDDILTEYLVANDEVDVAILSQISEAIHKILSSSTIDIPTSVAIPLSNDSNTSVTQHVISRNYITNLLKIKSSIQLVTNLLASGDQWLDYLSTFLNDTDRIILEQMDNNPLNDSLSFFTAEKALKMSSLGVEVYIDILYLYYRATEIRPTSSMFGERLKSHLEHEKCPMMLGFALSAATQNQVTLQRALVLQGVCLHLQDFNVELMGEKMYQFSSQFASLKFKIPVVSKQTPQRVLSPERKASTMLKTADGDNEYHQNTNDSPLATDSKRLVTDTWNSFPDLSGLDVSKANISNKSQTNKNVVDTEISNFNFIKANSDNEPSAASLTSNFNGDQIEKINLDMKVQQIVNKWMNHPEAKLSSNEIYAIFEHRIQSMQNQEALMEKIISNKTAALHQSEALLSQYRSNLAAAEKESKQLRGIQVEMESKFDVLTKKYEQLQGNMVELENMNQTLAENVRAGEKHKEECLAISKKLQERLLKLSEEKSRLQANLDTCLNQTEDLQKIVSQKDVQIANFTQVTKIINKLSGNKFSLDTLGGQYSIEELNKSLNSPSRSDHDGYINTNNNSEINQSLENKDPSTSSYRDQGIDHISKRTVSMSNFLDFYKNNSRFLMKKK